MFFVLSFLWFKAYLSIVYFFPLGGLSDWLEFRNILYCLFHSVKYLFIVFLVTY